MLSQERSRTRLLLELACTAHGEWDSTIRHVVEFDSQALGVERVSFWSLREESSSIHCDAGYVASSRMSERGATLFASDQPAYFEALRQDRVINVEDVGANPRTRGLREYWDARSVSSALNIPVWVDGRLAGVLCHEHVGARRRWTAGDECFAAGVSQVIAYALAARAHTLAEAAAHRAAFLDNAASVIMQSLDAGEIARRSVDIVVSELADFAFVWTLSRENRLECIAFAHADPHKRDLVAKVARTGYPAMTTHVIREKQALLIPDMTTGELECFGASEADRAVLSELGVRSILGVPLTVAGKTLGALTLFSASRPYDSQDLALAEDVASRVAVALENGRLYQVSQESIRARDDFLVLAAHELRTPITALQLAADSLVRSQPEITDATKRCDTIPRQVRRLTRLVDRLLDTVLIRAEGVALALAPFDFGELLVDRVKQCAERARQAKTTITLHVESPVVERWDRARLAQVVSDLLDNAIKFGDGKPIDVDLRSEGAEAVLTVRDQGIGISPDRLPSLFAPFERAAPKEHYSGLGLGLFIAKAIVEAHRGSIAVTSRLGEGATFVVRLPRATDRNEGQAT